MPGVFTLGEATAEVLTLIEEKKTKLAEITKEGTGYKNDIKKQEDACKAENNTFRETAWNDLLKQHEEYFAKSSIGASTKDNFLSKLINAFENKYQSTLSLDDLKNKACMLFGVQPVKQHVIDTITNEPCLAIESDGIWNKSIIGKQDIDIASLIMRLGCTDWVNQGMHYLVENSDICPFCQQHTITSDFKEKLNSFFDDSYKNDTGRIDTFIHDYTEHSAALLLNIENTIRIQKSNDKTFVDIASLETALATLKMTVSGNLELMNSKKKEPSRKISLTVTADVINSINMAISNANIAITENNRLVDNFTHERNQLVKNIWNFFANSYSATIDAHNKKIKGINKAIENLQSKRDLALTQYKAVQQELNKLEKSVTSVTPTVIEINRLLRGFGFTNFQIQEIPEKKNHYHIVRENGEPATTTLSEGERTFITFLYYMQLVKGSHNPENVSSNRILVIDDPVSSLDSNVLFVVSTLLRDIFTDIHESKGTVKQVLLLTHNVYFHKEIAYIDRHCKWRDCINHWILRKKDNVSSIQAYGKNSPIKSSYELMWAELKSNSLNSCIVTQNIMRRIIENYFQVFGGISPNVILDKFPNPEDKRICKSLLNWVNDGSHSLPEDLFVEMSDDQLERNKEVFRQIFDKMGQISHFDMMMQQTEKEDESVLDS